MLGTLGRGAHRVAHPGRLPRQAAEGHGIPGSSLGVSPNFRWPMVCAVIFLWSLQGASCGGVREKGQWQVSGKQGRIQGCPWPSLLLGQSVGP